MKDVTGKGGVVLKERFHVENSFVERSFRFRIFSEQGKVIAELPDLPISADDFAGRTIYPDGKVVIFDSKKDLLAKVILTDKRGDRTKKVLVPPGISADCIVDVRWKERGDMGRMPTFGIGWMRTWTWTPRFPTNKLEVEVSKELAWNWNFRPGNGKSKLISTDTLNSKVLTLTDLPPTEWVPFTVGPGFDAPRLEIFPIPRNIADSYDKEYEAYWKDVVARIYKPLFDERPSGGFAYRALSKEIRKDLDGSPAKQAGDILSRLNTKIKNLSSLTYAEKALMAGGKPDWNLHPFDMNQSASERATDALGMFILAYSVMKDAGIKLKIAFVANRDVRRIVAKTRNPNQFTNLILGVDQAGDGIFWMDPALRFAAPGMLNPDYQGTLAFVVNTADWTGKFEGLGTQSAGFNQTRYTYHLNIGGDQDAVKLKVGFSGYPEYAERFRFMSLEPKEQSKTLKESLERISKSVTITKAEVANATNPREDLRWEVEGAREREAGRRLEIEPFPLMQWPLFVPDKWPDTREEFIVLPHNKIHLAVSTIELPKDYVWKGIKEIVHSNEFGRVVWMAEKKSTLGAEEIKVVLRVELNQSLGPSTMYSKLKEFVFWVEEACRRRLIVEKVN